MFGADVSFVVLGGRAALVVDFPSAGHQGPLSPEDDPVVWSFTGHGLQPLASLDLTDLTRSDDLRCAEGHGRIALMTPQGVEVIAIEEAEVPLPWCEAAGAQETVALLVGRDLALAALLDEPTVTSSLGVAAAQRRLLGAEVAFD